MLVLLGLLQVAPPSIANAQLRAEFGPRGLVALSDVAQHAVYRLTRDAFRLTIGGTSYVSAGLPAPTVTAVPLILTEPMPSGDVTVIEPVTVSDGSLLLPELPSASSPEPVGKPFS